MTIAKAIELEDHYENIGAKLVAEAASKTNDIAGDGTTTATVLTQAIVQEGMKNVVAGANPVAFAAGLKRPPKQPLTNCTRTATKFPAGTKLPKLLQSQVLQRKSAN